MKMINIAICDDEQSILDWLHKKIAFIFNQKSLVFNISTFKNGNLLLNAHKINNFDIVFLDIDMKPIDGFQTAEKLREVTNNLYIVFVTSKHHLMKNSFDYQPFNFICKDSLDILYLDLEHVCNTLIKHFKQHTNITIKDNFEGEYDIPICDLIYINSDKHYLIYHVLFKTPSDCRLLELRERGTIAQKEIELSNYDFLKPHRRYLVNMRHITKLDKVSDNISLSNGDIIPISQKLKSDILHKFMIYKRR